MTEAALLNDKQLSENPFLMISEKLRRQVLNVLMPLKVFLYWFGKFYERN
jgi:hypothetical protein